MPQRPAITDEVRSYIDSAAVAARYDSDHHGFSLFDLDSALVREVAADLPRPASAIDLGCGTGRTLVELARLGFSALGVDLSQSMLEMASARVMPEREAGANVRLFKGDISDLGFLPDGAVDLATCLYSTFGLIAGRENRVQCLRGIRRVLRPGGRVILHVHNRWFPVVHPGHAWRLFRSWLRARRSDHEFGDHYFDDYFGLVPRMFIHAFGPAELHAHLADAGFVDIDVRYINRNRSGWLTRGPLRILRANGFFAVARRS